MAHEKAGRCLISDLVKGQSALFQQDVGVLGEDRGWESDPGFTAPSGHQEAAEVTEGGVMVLRTDCLHALSLPMSCGS